MLLYSVILIFCVKKLRLKCHKVIHTFRKWLNLNSDLVLSGFKALLISWYWATIKLRVFLLCSVISQTCSVLLFGFVRILTDFLPPNARWVQTLIASDCSYMWLWRILRLRYLGKNIYFWANFLSTQMPFLCAMLHP